jgi:hypothetical protein
MRIRIQDPGFSQPWIWDSEWKKSDQGSWINIPDPQHWSALCTYTVPDQVFPKNDGFISVSLDLDPCLEPEAQKAAYCKKTIKNYLELFKG